MENVFKSEAAGMTKKRFALLNAIREHGNLPLRRLKDMTGLSVGSLSKAMKELKLEGLVGEAGLTDRGLAALAPYRVRNAVILAAGMSHQFVPLSLEMPKGLLRVKGEILIERQIRQLQAAGIQDITLVLGFKKEAFFYLESMFEGLRIIINPEYHLKNNSYSLALARGRLDRTYVCVSDVYYVENPFSPYMFQSVYAGIRVEAARPEYYMDLDAKGRIRAVRRTGDRGAVMLGHAYFDGTFGPAFAALLQKEMATGDYSQQLWEEILRDNIRRLPPMYGQLYAERDIFEFDTLEELRRFDQTHVYKTQSVILNNIVNTFHCRPEEVSAFELIKEGLTNTSFIFSLRGRKYVYRHPGEGTEKLLSRKREKKALEIARDIGIDPSYIAMDEEAGWKISHYIADARMPEYDSPEDSRTVIACLRRLHDARIDFAYAFDPYQDALRLEGILRGEKNGIADPTFDELKSRITRLYAACQGDGVVKTLCHCDTYRPNWMLRAGKDTVLIDWEYAAFADPGCDVGYYICDAMWDFDRAEAFIRAYLGEDFTPRALFHHLCYTAIISFYWYVWALYREACDAVMGDALYRWHYMAVKYAGHLIARLEQEENDA